MSNPFIQFSVPMESRSASEIHKRLKLVTRPHTSSLARLFSAPIEQPPGELLETMTNFKFDAAILSEGISDFAKKCLQDQDEGEEMIEDLDRELSSCLWLTRQIADLEEFHPTLFPYLLQIKIKVRPVRKKLRRKTGFYTSGRRAGNSHKAGDTFINSSQVNLVQYNGPAPATPPEELFANTPFYGPAEAERTSEGKDPGSEKTAVQQPAPEFPLPDYLEILPLKAEEKARFLRFLKFINTNPLSFRFRMYALLLLDLDLVLEEHFRQKKDLDLILNRLCGNSSKDPREASGYRCKYRNPDSRAKARYILKGKYPEFEEQVRSLH